jgi:hypothetical protein
LQIEACHEVHGLVVVQRHEEGGATHDMAERVVHDTVLVLLVMIHYWRPVK